MKVVIVGSGSKGNCTYIETPQSKILIDSGISHLQVKNTLSKYGLSLKDLDAIFITHEHTDHMRHLVSIMSRTRAKVFMYESSFVNSNRILNGGIPKDRICFIDECQKYEIKDIAVVAIKLSHDTTNCFGYLVKELNTSDNISYASITDTGYLDSKYYPLLSSINTLLIESNHDVEMLLGSSRPWILKKRILSECGHLSNVDCVKALKQIVSSYTQNIILGHISEECNDYDLAYDYCKDSFKDNLSFNLFVAKQYEELVIDIKDNQND